MSHPSLIGISSLHDGKEKYACVCERERERKKFLAHVNFKIRCFCSRFSETKEKGTIGDERT